MKPKFFQLAKVVSARSDHHSHLIGCVITKKNRVVSVGHNQMKTHPRTTHLFKFLHAEAHAILGTPLSDLKGATAYIYREHKDGKLALSRPCCSCLGMLRVVGIKKICYTDYGTYKEEIL